MISILSKQSLFVIDARAAFLWRHNDQLLILSFNRLITTPTCPSSAFNCRRQTKSEEIRSKKASNFGVNNVMSCHRSFARIFNKFFSCRNSRGLDNWMWKGEAEKIRIQIGLAWKRRKNNERENQSHRQRIYRDVANIFHHHQFTSLLFLSWNKIKGRENVTWSIEKEKMNNIGRQLCAEIETKKLTRLVTSCATRVRIKKICSELKIDRICCCSSNTMWKCKYHAEH